MRWVFYVLSVVVLLIAVVFGVGLLLPASHVASVRATVPASPEDVYGALTSVAGAAEWRSGLDSVVVLSAPGDPLRWREFGQYGRIEFVQEAAEPPTRWVARIESRDVGFGGRWIYEMVPDTEGTTVTITEQGEVYNPAFRFLSRFVFGHTSTMEAYLRDLGARFGASVEPEPRG